MRIAFLPHTSAASAMRLEMEKEATAKTARTAKALDQSPQTVSAAEIVASLPRPPFAYRGPIVWLWSLLSPVAAVAMAACVAFGALPAVPFGALFLATVWKFNRLAEAFDANASALKLSNLGKDSWGALAEILEWPSRRARGIARALLTQLLPQVGPGDARLFTEEQMQFLYEQLRPNNARRNPQLVVAILAALEHVGAAEALAPIRRVAHMRAFTPGMRNARAAARRCLAVMEERLVRESEAPVEGELLGSLPLYWPAIPPAMEERLRGEFLAPENGDLPRAAPLHADDRLSGMAESRSPAAGELRDGAARLADAPVEEVELELTPEIREANAALDAQLKRFTQEQHRRRPGMRLGFLIASWCTMVPFFAVHTVDALLAHRWWLSLLCGALMGAATQLHRVTLVPRHSRLARELAEMDDVRCVGRLCEVLEWPDADARSLAIATLTHLLPRLKASDFDLLPSGSRARGNLYRMLKVHNVHFYPDMLIATLQALEQIGDRDAVPYVQHLAVSRAVTARHVRVRNRAHECLPFLLQRAEQSQVSQTLLRASAANSAPSDALLRPAAVGDGNEQAELLRAGTPAIDGE